ncbi:uncharacterized protein LOC134767117 [Penaeus indicus]|uniref:uncharacterized protein LOC134767117 n=1 Tax=Penaeus indicus TaxID=29960 RepID=UPI00300D4743
MAQGTDHPPTITIDGHMLEAVGNFTYLGSSISSSHTHWKQKSAAGSPKLQQLCRNCTREAGTTPVSRKRLSCVSIKPVRSAPSSTAVKHGHPTQGMRRDSTASTSDVYDAFFTSAGRTKSQMVAILQERRLRWLSHVRRMDAGRIQKDLLYGELAEGIRPNGRPRLRYKDVCKRDMKQIKEISEISPCSEHSQQYWSHVGMPENQRMSTDIFLYMVSFQVHYHIHGSNVSICLPAHLTCSVLKFMGNITFSIIFIPQP